MAFNYGLKERFERLYLPEPNTGCWLWTGTTNNQGYGKMTISKKGTKTYPRAHRVSYELFNGPIKSGLIVCHKCDTPSCVNPDHLFIGSVKDNVQDSIKKGRSAITTATHCNKGHLWSEANTLFLKRKDTGRIYRRCLECKRDRGRATYYRNYIGRRKKTPEEKYGV